jgi:arylsulfatase B
MDLYQDQTPQIAAFYGMITNIDDNIAQTRALLTELGIADNTLFIFTTDNGTATGAGIFNAGMKGAKGSEFDGGHRVPFIAHWPAAGWNQAHSSDILCHAVDIVPTLLEITGATPPPHLKLDGISIRPLLDPKADTTNWPHERMLVTDSQRVRDPVKWKQTSVMSGKWRLVNGTQLHNNAQDPGQQHNLIDQHPQQAAAMIAFYDAWWAELEPTFSQTTEIHLGHPDHPNVTLTGHDWIQENLPPWNQQHIRVGDGYATAPNKATAGKKAQPTPKNPAPSKHQGHWAVKVLHPGTYEISLRRWPAEADHPITAPRPPGANVPGASKAFRANPGIAIPATQAVLRLNGRDLDKQTIQTSDRSITFTTELTSGSHQLAPVFIDAKGNEIGAYYAIIKKLD